MHSVLSYPVRSRHGDAAYPGNTNGAVIVDLIRQYRPRTICDPFLGGNTTRDVVEELNRSGYDITLYGGDLRFGEGPGGYNILQQPITDIAPTPFDWGFMHLAYWIMKRYSSHPDDLSNFVDYGEWLAMSRVAALNLYRGLRRGGRYTLQIADYRKDGTYYPLSHDLYQLLPGRIENVLIKTQHNVSSRSKDYPGGIIRIAHEYLYTLVRTETFFSLLGLTLENSRRLKALADATWQAVCEVALREHGGEASVQQVCDFIAEQAAEKTVNNTNWPARVRATLRSHFPRSARGHYRTRNCQRAEDRGQATPLPLPHGRASSGGVATA